MTVVLILFLVLLVSLRVYKNTKKQKFTKGVYYKLEWGKFIEQPKRTAKEEALHTLETNVTMYLPSGRLTNYFVQACWVLHVKFNPEKHITRHKMSERINRRLKDGRGWQSAVLDAASNRGQFTNNK